MDTTTGESRVSRVVEECFSLKVREVMTCPACGRSSPQPPHEYDTHVFYLPVRSLMEAAATSSPTSAARAGSNNGDRHVPDALLQAVGRGDLYSCSHQDCPLMRAQQQQHQHSSRGRGGGSSSSAAPRLVAARRYLVQGPPRVLSLGLVWDSLKSDPRKIETVLRLIEPVIHLDSLTLPTASSATGSPVHGQQRQQQQSAELRGFFAFHPNKHHYVAFLCHEHSQEQQQQEGGGQRRWVSVDDSEVRVLGPDASDALAVCAEQQYQPSLLFYQLLPPTPPPPAQQQEQQHTPPQQRPQSSSPTPSSSSSSSASPPPPLPTAVPRKAWTGQPLAVQMANGGAGLVKPPPLPTRSTSSSTSSSSSSSSGGRAAPRA